MAVVRHMPAVPGLREHERARFHERRQRPVSRTARELLEQSAKAGHESRQLAASIGPALDRGASSQAFAYFMRSEELLEDAIELARIATQQAGG